MTECPEVSESACPLVGVGLNREGSKWKAQLRKLMNRARIFRVFGAALFTAAMILRALGSEPVEELKTKKSDPPATHTVKRGALKCEQCHGNLGATDKLPLFQQDRISGYSRDIWGAGGRPGMTMDDCVACHRQRRLESSCMDCHK